jgi:hypothetical protein
MRYASILKYKGKKASKPSPNEISISGLLALISNDDLHISGKDI